MANPYAVPGCHVSKNNKVEADSDKYRMQISPPLIDVLIMTKLGCNPTLSDPTRAVAPPQNPSGIRGVAKDGNRKAKLVTRNGTLDCAFVAKGRRRP
jgi:hypothetical protein